MTWSKRQFRFSSLLIAVFVALLFSMPAMVLTAPVVIYVYTTVLGLQVAGVTNASIQNILLGCEFFILVFVIYVVTEKIRTP